MNKVILIGRLCADPELGYTQSEKAVCKLRLAVDGPYKEPDGKPATEFINITAWGKTAENCANYLAKGRKVAVDGAYHTNVYEAKDIIS